MFLFIAPILVDELKEFATPIKEEVSEVSSAIDISFLEDNIYTWRTNFVRKIVWKSTGKRLTVKQEKTILETFEQLKDEGAQGRIGPDALYGFNMALKALELEIVDEG